MRPRAGTPLCAMLSCGHSGLCTSAASTAQGGTPPHCARGAARRSQPAALSAHAPAQGCSAAPRARPPFHQASAASSCSTGAELVHVRPRCDCVRGVPTSAVRTAEGCPRPRIGQRLRRCWWWSCRCSAPCRGPAPGARGGDGAACEAGQPGAASRATSERAARGQENSLGAGASEARAL